MDEGCVPCLGVNSQLRICSVMARKRFRTAMTSRPIGAATVSSSCSTWSEKRKTRFKSARCGHRAHCGDEGRAAGDTEDTVVMRGGPLETQRTLW